ncbi:MAG: aminoglycoside phosphotransferase family protein [Chloroflexi bacterium]|nr:aminoglycoside phosphotransferase family protein [Chloroflexota bacterium]
MECPQQPPIDLVSRLERIAGRPVASARKATGGYTHAERWIVTFSGGSTAFAKSAHDLPQSPAARWLRQEFAAYGAISAEFMPRLLGWDDDGERPVLLLEDLSRATWPPPWTPELVRMVWDGLDEVAATPPPDLARDLEARTRALLSGWERIRVDPAPFLGLRLCSEMWLQRSIDTLIAAAGAARLAGDALVHSDTRSDNLCIARGPGGRPQLKLVDWNLASRGNRDFDRLSWLPSLHAEGGPAPWELAPDSKGMSALLAGYFAAQAGLPLIPTAPRVRVVQLLQLRSALPWAVRELALPPLDGSAALAAGEQP